MDAVVENLEAVLKGGSGVQETEYMDERLSAAIALQGIARNDTPSAKAAWCVLSTAVVDTEFRVALRASLAVAYTAIGTGDAWDNACRVYREAVDSADRGTRIAGVKGVRKAVELNPEIADVAADLLAGAAVVGLNRIVDTNDDMATVAEISESAMRRERSSWKAMAGLSAVTMGRLSRLCCARWTWPNGWPGRFGMELTFGPKVIDTIL